MPPRPAIKTREGRPISAIYIGANPNGGGSTASHIAHAPHSSSSSAYLANGASPALPDLPEPPSPDSSVGSRGSGLPSPPATNSTGSGSTGDPGSIALRQRPLSFASDSSASTSGSSHRTLSEHTTMPSTPGSNRSSSRQAQLQDDKFSNHDDDRHDDHDLDGDDTARLDRRHHPKSSSENVLALQRVKNLTQRNRMAIDKLTRLGSPSPSNSGSRSTGSPVPSHTSSSTSSKLRQTRTVLLPNTSDRGVSGSETERERESIHAHSSHSHSSSSPASSSRRPITPPPPENNIVALANTTSPYSRLRHISAPESPQKARLLNAASGSSNSSGSPTNRRRKRASMASMAAIRAYENDEEEDEEGGNGRASRFSTATGPLRDRGDTVREVTQSALAAVASSRRSPVGTRRRGALPREFRDGSDAVDVRSVTSEARKNDDSPDRKRLTIEPVTPYRGSHRSSTLRETRRSGGASTARWASEDYRSATMGSGGEPKRERRQTLRGGSAESALWSPGGRTLIGEGLRAAGMSFRRDEVRTLGPSSATADVFRERERHIDWSPQDLEDKGKRRVFTPARELTTRAATSMADYRSLDRREVDRKESVLVRREEEADRSRALRNHRSTYSLSTAMERGSSILQRNRELSLTRTERDQLELDRMSQPPSATITQPPTATTVVPKHLQDRHATASPFSSKRMSQTPVPGATPAADHVRLMLECLASFEGNVSKLPSTAVSNLSKIPSPAALMKHAQNVVYTTERINALMRHGTNRALEEQISAEVDGEETARSQDMLDVWRKVGGEYREGLRASDELVRALTSFIMDVGSTLRKLSPSSGSEYGSPAVHARSISLDEEGLRQQQQLRSTVSPDLTGRRSVGSSSRKSWDPAMRDREREREETLRKLGAGAARESPPGFARASPALSAIRDRDRNVYGTPSPASTAAKPLPPLNPNGAMPSPNLPGSMRRLFTPSQQRENRLDGQVERPGSSLRPSDSQKTLQGNEVEPPPTPPATKTRTKTLPPAPLPRPLPILASEQSRRTPVSQPTNTNSNSTTTSSASVERSSTSSRNRRKASVTSIVTIRGSQAPPFPGLTTPSTATTGVTAHTVSNSPEQTPSILRSISSKSARSTVTFSRPTNSAVSAALSGIQQQAREDERKRAGALNDTSASASSDASQSLSQPRLEIQQQPKRLAVIALAKAQSGPEAERDLSRRNTTRELGTSPSPRIMRMSLDGSALLESGRTGTPFGKGSTAHAADRHAASTVLPRVGKERRRTVTDIWPRD